MQIHRIGIWLILGTAAAALAAPARADTLADSVNAGLSGDNDAFWGVDDVGWLYTPGISYNLSGINTLFSIPVGTLVEDRNVTVAVYKDNTPTNGGMLLGSFSFNSSLADGQLGGGSFSTPISLTAGQQYFVGFEEVGPLNPTPNVDDLGVNFTGDPSATSLSDAFYDVSGKAGCSTAHTFACEDPNRDFLSQPILQFFAPSPSDTPEPGTGVLLSGAFGIGLLWVLRSKRAFAVKP